MLNADWPALLAALSSTNLSDSILSDVLGALQTLVRATGCVSLPTPHDGFFTAVAKPALPPRVVATLDAVLAYVALVWDWHGEFNPGRAG